MIVAGTGNVQAALQKANADLEEANRELHDLREVWSDDALRHVHFCALDACSKLPVCMALTAASVLFKLAHYPGCGVAAFSQYPLCLSLFSVYVVASMSVSVCAL